MKNVLFVIMLFFLSAITYAQQSADKILGTWESTNSEVKLKFDIYKSNDKYFGKLLYASTMYEADGKTPKKDFKNPSKNLQNRSRQNIVNITNLIYTDGEYSNGKLYNPDDGDTYSLKAKMTSSNNLEFRGYKGISLLGKTLKFKRI